MLHNIEHGSVVSPGLLFLSSILQVKLGIEHFVLVQLSR
jgi:hypothetical protein